MKNILLLLTICFLSFNTNAQENITDELEKAYDAKKYNMIISKHTKKVKDYPAKAIFYVGMAHYMKSNDEKAIELMDLSIQKDKTDPGPYFIKGMTYYYMEQYDKAIDLLMKANELDSTNSKHYSSLGDAYFKQKKYEKALSAYITATEKADPLDRPFAMIPHVYEELGQTEKALEAFYKSKENVSKESKSYKSALYNIGHYELLNKEYNKSETAFKELIGLTPDDFHSISKLIQVYYAKKEYKKAKPLKDELYKAYHKGSLKSAQFCFDQFDWNDKHIIVVERFAVEKGELYYKHIFYIKNKESDETEFTIQTENSPISEELGGPKYLLGMDKDGTHSTFNYGFKEDLNYENLKKTVILVLEEEINPAASSRIERK